MRRRAPATALVLLLLAGACTPGANPPGGAPAAGEELVPDSRLLPPPLEAPGRGAERARLLAREVLAGGERGTAALLTALADSGIAVRDRSLGDRVVVEASQPSQGLAVQAADVLAMMRLEGRGYQATLADVGALLRMPGLGLERAPVERLLASAIADHAQRGEPPLRSWAAFIVELGRQGPAGYDLAHVRDPAELPLDGVQTFLILLRLFADAYAIGGEGSPGASPGALGAALPGLLGAGAGLGSHLSASGELPCTLSDAEGFVMDRAAFVASTGFGQLWGRLELPGSSLLGAAGVALTVLRFLAIQAIFDPRIELVPPPPLVRTKKTNVDAETRELRATIRMDVGRAQMLNCFRIMLNAAGLDFSLPNDGPVQGAEVLWRCVSGCRVGEPLQLCALPCSGAGGIQSGDPSRNAYETRTGEDGVARTGIQGRRQKRELGDWALEVRKEATVAITVKLTTPNLVKDLVSVGETVAGGAIGVPRGRDPGVHRRAARPVRGARGDLHVPRGRLGAAGVPGALDEPRRLDLRGREVRRTRRYLGDRPPGAERHRRGAARAERTQPIGTRPQHMGRGRDCALQGLRERALRRGRSAHAADTVRTGHGHRPVRRNGGDPCRGRCRNPARSGALRGGRGRGVRAGSNVGPDGPARRG